MSTQHQFGGEWTRRKLEVLRKYLSAYTRILTKYPFFKIIYVDAFAGTGNIQLTHLGEPHDLLDPEYTQFIKGSARVAIEVEPPFDEYLFIEKDEKYARQLNGLREEFPKKDSQIRVVNADANDFLKAWCNQNQNYWEKHRAVVFLDPYGMQVSWEVTKALAETKAVDLWYLFPVGAVNRLMPREGPPNDAWAKRLTTVFGDENWREAFYETQNEDTLFGPKEQLYKHTNPEKIGEYMISRLRTVFKEVASKFLILKNSKNSPIFIFCFAASNQKGADTAVKIAEDILMKEDR